MQPTMQRKPPETIEKRSDVSDASTPASRSPRLGALATCVNSIPESRPRRWSGVERSSIVLRSTALKKSAPPGDGEQDERRPQRRHEPEAGDRRPPRARRDRHRRRPAAARATSTRRPASRRARLRTARSTGSRRSPHSPSRLCSASAGKSARRHAEHHRVRCRRRRFRSAPDAPSGSGSRRGSSSRSAGRPRRAAAASAAPRWRRTTPRR